MPLCKLKKHDPTVGRYIPALEGSPSWKTGLSPEAPGLRRRAEPVSELDCPLGWDPHPGCDLCVCMVHHWVLYTDHLQKNPFLWSNFPLVRISVPALWVQYIYIYIFHKFASSSSPGNLLETDQSYWSESDKIRRGWYTLKLHMCCSVLLLDM